MWEGEKTIYLGGEIVRSNAANDALYRKIMLDLAQRSV